MYLMLLEGSYPQDIRVRKEAESMAENGCDILIITPWKKGELREETINKVKVKRIGINYTFNTKGILDILNSIFFVNWLFYFGVKKIIKNNNIKVIHFHDLPLMKTSYLFAKRINIPVIFDMHENYPEMMEEYKMSRKSMLKKIKDSLFFEPKRWKKYEATYIVKMNHIISVVDEMKEKLILEYSIDSEKITIVSNFEKLNFSTETENDDFKFDQNTFYIAYIGGISPIRGLETVIHACELMIKKKKKIHFLVIGSGNINYEKELYYLSNSLNLNNHITFLGQKPFKKINYYMKNVDLNIIPHLKTEHTDHTIPHKLFQIFLSKAPILVSSCKPLQRFIETTKGGYVFEAGNSINLSEKIIEIIENKNEKRLKAENAYKFTINNLSWEKEAKKLDLIYEKFHG
jgi:glycosyltransferase involved in cell wall biosynthesis